MEVKKQLKPIPKRKSDSIKPNERDAKRLKKMMKSLSPHERKLQKRYNKQKP